MDATQTFEQWFEQADNALPVLTQSARIMVVTVGVLLALIGGRLVKTACIVGGLALGMIAGGLTLAFVDSAMVGVGFMVGLGLLGALGAWLMFRAWVALAAAVMFAVIAPAGVMVWQGTSAQDLTDDNQAGLDQLEQRYDAASTELNEETRLQVQSLISQGDTESLGKADKLLEEQGFGVVENARGIVFRNIEEMGRWWEDNSTALQRTLGLAMLIGAGVGFLFGLILPSYAVSVQSAIVGAVLIVIPGRELFINHLPQMGDLVPTSPRGTLLAIGLITVLALGLQWTLYLRRVDKEA